MQIKKLVWSFEDRATCRASLYDFHVSCVFPIHLEVSLCNPMIPYVIMQLQANASWIIWTSTVAIQWGHIAFAGSCKL